MVKPTWRCDSHRLLRLPLPKHRLDIIEQLDLRPVLAHDDRLLRNRQRIVPRPVDHQAGGEACQHEGEDDRHPVEDDGLRRVGRRRVELHLQLHGDAHDHHPGAEMQEMPEHRQHGGVERDQPEQVEDVGQVGRRQVVDPAEERRAADLADY